MLFAMIQWTGSGVLQKTELSCLMEPKMMQIFLCFLSLFWIQKVGKVVAHLYETSVVFRKLRRGTETGEEKKAKKAGASFSLFLIVQFFFEEGKSKVCYSAKIRWEASALLVLKLCWPASEAIKMFQCDDKWGFHRHWEFIFLSNISAM